MKLSEIEFEDRCCAGHSTAEVKVSFGWVALTRTIGELGVAYRVRKFGEDKLAVSDWEDADESQIAEILAS